MKLLTMAHQNAKTAKNSKHGQYLSSILHLSPFNLSGFQVCPAASKGCAMACLNTAGRGRFSNVQEARKRKTRLFFQNREQFLGLLVADIQSLVNKAIREGKKAVVRLNGTSDIVWEKEYLYKNSKITIFDLFPMVQFYDYSKRLDRIKNKIPSNYHLTFSASEINEKACKQVLKLGYNVATVFKQLPDTFWGHKVINGDDTDLRFLEGYNGYIVGLTAKGKAKKDTSGFVK